jgi:hypothetical protein
LGGAAETTDTGDALVGGQGTDTLTLTGMGVSTALVQTESIETVNVKAAGADSGITQTLMDGVTNLNSEGSLFDFAVTGGDLSTTYGLNNTGKAQEAGLTVTYTTVAGTSTTSKLSVNNAGDLTNDTTTRQIISVINGNGVEAVTLATSGTNYIDLRAGTAAATITVSGSGTNDITIGSSAANVTVDASSTNGANTINMGTGLTSNDTIKGGSASDEVSATIANAVAVRSTLTSVEALDVNFTAAGTLDLRSATSVATLDLSGSTAAIDVNNASAALKTAVFDATSNVAMDIDYASGVTGSLTFTVGEADAGDGAAVTLGAITTDATTLAINSIGDAANTTAAVTANSATSFTVTTNSEDTGITVGGLTLDAVTTIKATATGGNITVGALADATTLTTLNLSATGDANLNIGAIGNGGAADDEAFALEELKVTVANGNLTMGIVNVSNADSSALNNVDIAVGNSSTVNLNDAGIFIEGNDEAEDAALDQFKVTAGDDLNLDAGIVQVDSIDEISVTIGEDGDATFDDIVATSIGDIVLTAGDNSTITLEDLQSVGGEIGDITMIGDSFSVTVTDADQIGTIDATDATGTVTINISNAAVDSASTILLGAGTNTLTVSQEDDEITLAEEDGTDTIQTGTVAGEVTINNFEVGAAADNIAIDISGVFALLAGADEVVHIVNTTDEIAAADAVVFQTATTVANTRDLDNAAAGSNILVLDTDFETAALVIDGDVGIATGGDFVITLGDNIAADDGFLVLWDDGANSYLSLVENIDGDLDGATMAAASLTITQLITFTGISDVADIVAGNFNAFA